MRQAGIPFLVIMILAIGLLAANPILGPFLSNFFAIATALVAVASFIFGPQNVREWLYRLVSPEVEPDSRNDKGVDVPPSRPVSEPAGSRPTTPPSRPAVSAPPALPPKSPTFDDTRGSLWDWILILVLLVLSPFFLLRFLRPAWRSVLSFVLSFFVLGVMVQFTPDWVHAFVVTAGSFKYFVMDGASTMLGYGQPSVLFALFVGDTAIALLLFILFTRVIVLTLILWLGGLIYRSLFGRSAE